MRLKKDMAKKKNKKGQKNLSGSSGPTGRDEAYSESAIDLTNQNGDVSDSDLDINELLKKYMPEYQNAPESAPAENGDRQSAPEDGGDGIDDLFMRPETDGGDGSDADLDALLNSLTNGLAFGDDAGQDANDETGGDSGDNDGGDASYREWRPVHRSTRTPAEWRQGSRPLQAA